LCAVWAVALVIDITPLNAGLYVRTVSHRRTPYF
jgi:hypothetical protein